MKKVFAIALLLCLVLGAAFAAKGKAEVGAQLGWGNDFTNIEARVGTASGKEELSEGGFYFTATAAYGVSDDIDIKAEAGILTMGKGKVKYTGNYWSAGSGDAFGEAVPVNFSLYVGAEYNVDLTKEFLLETGIGVDMMIGKQTPASDDTANGRIGVGAEVIGKYAINKNINVLLGAKFSVYFINTGNKDTSAIPLQINNIKKGMDLLGGSLGLFQGGFKIFAGATYKI